MANRTDRVQNGVYSAVAHISARKAKDGMPHEIPFDVPVEDRLEFPSERAYALYLDGLDMDARGSAVAKSGLAIGPTPKTEEEKKASAKARGAEAREVNASGKIVRNAGIPADELREILSAAGYDVPE